MGHIRNTLATAVIGAILTTAMVAADYDNGIAEEIDTLKEGSSQ